MVNSDDMKEQHQIALRLIEQAKRYEQQGQEPQAIATYLQAGEEAARGRLFDNPELDVFPQIYAGLRGRMQAVWEGYELKIQSGRRGLRRVEGTNVPIYKVE